MYDSRNLPDFTKATIDEKIKEILSKNKPEIKIPEQEIKKESIEPKPPVEPISTK